MFAELNLKDQELETYQGLWNFLKDRVRQPNAVIYLYAEPDFLLERIHQRDRPFERGIKLQYLQSLADAYEKMLANYRTSPVVRIASDSEPARNPKSWRRMAEELIRVVPQLSGKINASC